MTNGSTFGHGDIASGSVYPRWPPAKAAFNSTATFDPSAPRRVQGGARRPGRARGNPHPVRRGHRHETKPTSHIDIRSTPTMAYDVHNDRLVSTSRGTRAWCKRSSIDPESGRSRPSVRPMFETNGTNLRLAVDDAGQIYLLTSLQRAPAEGLKDMLSNVFTRLGLCAILAGAPVTLESRYWSEPTMPVTLASTRPSGAELVAYDSHGDGSRQRGDAGSTPVYRSPSTTPT